ADRAGPGRVGRDEGDVGEGGAPMAAEADQVLPVRAVAVQQDDEAAGRAPRGGRELRAIETGNGDHGLLGEAVAPGVKPAGGRSGRWDDSDEGPIRRRAPA